MFSGDRRRRIVCVVGCDQDSLVALQRARAWQVAWPCAVRAIFLVSDELPATRTPEPSWLQAWSERQAGLELALKDVLVCRFAELPRIFEQGAGMLTGMVVCPAPTDSATEVAGLSLRTMWARAARLQAPLLVARAPVTPRRVLVATDGTARTLPVLRMAFELGQNMDASLSYLDVMRIPLARSNQLLSPSPALSKRAHLSLVSAASSTVSEDGSIPYAHATYGLAAAMAKASARERADILVVGVSAEDRDMAEKIIDTAPCSVLAVPCQPER